MVVKAVILVQKIREGLTHSMSGVSNLPFVFEVLRWAKVVHNVHSECSQIVEFHSEAEFFPQQDTNSLAYRWSLRIASALRF